MAKLTKREREALEWLTTPGAHYRGERPKGVGEVTLDDLWFSGYMVMRDADMQITAAGRSALKYSSQ